MSLKITENFKNNSCTASSGYATITTVLKFLRTFNLNYNFLYWRNVMKSGIPTLTLHGDSAIKANAVERFREVCRINGRNRGDVLLELIRSYTDHDGVGRSTNTSSVLIHNFNDYCQDNNINKYEQLNKLLSEFLNSVDYFSKFKQE